MAEEVGIVMSLYDRVTPTLKAIAGSSQAFDKTLDELEESIKSYDRNQEAMVKQYASLKKAMAETDNQVKAAHRSYKKLNDEASKKALDEAIDRQAELRRALNETESSLKANSRAYDDLYERAKGIQAQTDWLGGVSGEAQQEANRAIGAWQASLENAKEAAIRDAVDAAMETTDYREAKEAGDAAEMGRIIMEAKVQGMNEYNASEGAQLALESEKALVAGLRADASLQNDYWDAGYEMGQEYSKGWISGRDAALVAGDFSYVDVTSSSRQVRPDSGIKGRYAYGLDRVPYDNYAALLHEGERVLTAREAREQDRSGDLPPISISVSGNTFGAGMDEAAVAEAIAQAVSRKLQAGFQV